jgi:hypothetical protein
MMIGFVSSELSRLSCFDEAESIQRTPVLSLISDAIQDKKTANLHCRQ